MSESQDTDLMPEEMFEEEEEVREYNLLLMNGLLLITALALWPIYNCYGSQSVVIIAVVVALSAIVWRMQWWRISIVASVIIPLAMMYYGTYVNSSAEWIIAGIGILLISASMLLISLVTSRKIEKDEYPGAYMLIFILAGALWIFSLNVSINTPSIIHNADGAEKLIIETGFR